MHRDAGRLNHYRRGILIWATFMHFYLFKISTSCAQLQYLSCCQSHIDTSARDPVTQVNVSPPPKVSWPSRPETCLDVLGNDLGVTKPPINYWWRTLVPNQSVLQSILPLEGRQQVSRRREEESSDTKKLLNSEKRLLVMRVQKYGKRDELIFLREENFRWIWTLPASQKADLMWMWTLVLLCSSSSCSVFSCWWPYSAVLRWCWTLTVLFLSPCTRQSKQKTESKGKALMRL